MSGQDFYAKQKFINYLNSHFDIDLKNASKEQIYYALSGIVNDLIYDKKCKNLLNNSNNIQNKPALCKFFVAISPKSVYINKGRGRRRTVRPDSARSLPQCEYYARCELWKKAFIPESCSN